MKNTIIATFILLGMTMISCKKDEQTNPNPSTSNLEARVIKDTTYNNQDLRQTIDIYLPKGRTSNTKVIVLIHGGAWAGGDKSEMNTVIPKIQKAWPDVAIANINYRYANGTTILGDQLIEDINASIEFLKANKDNFKISTNFGLIGASAGAHLALHYSYLYNNDKDVKVVSDLYGPSHIDDWEWYQVYNPFLGANIKDIFYNLTGTYWNTDVYARYSPYRYVSPQASVPTIIFHGTVDPIVPIYQSQWLKAKLHELKIPYEYYEYNDIHGFNDENNTDCMNKTVAFFKKHL